MKKVKVQFPKIGAQHAAPQATKTMKNPVSQDQATQAAKEMIKKMGIPKDDLIKIGQLADAAIKDKSKYSEYVKYLVNKGVDADKLKKPDFQMMSTMVVLGKVAQGM